MARNKTNTSVRKSKPPLTPASSVTAVSEHEIAERAYLKWQARGCPIGDDMRDWFEARQELVQERE